MAKYATTKMVEALEVNQTTGARTSRRIELPYGSVIENAREEDRFLRFVYLGKTYDVKLPDIQGYYNPIGGQSKPQTKAAATDEGPAAPEAKSSLLFEPLESNLSVKRAKVPGGWLVAIGSGVAFVPDPSHKWDGASID